MALPIAFEDIQVGDRYELGSVQVTRDEILDFARKFDPQPFHLDEEAGKRSHFGGLVASGWHTASMCMRLMVDGFMSKSLSQGSPGVDELRWLRPVRPGDTLTAVGEVLECTPSRSRLDRGSLRVRYTLTNQTGERVFSMIGIGLIGRRNA
jgi:acyl dehydratase